MENLTAHVRLTQVLVAALDGEFDGLFHVPKQFIEGVSLADGFGDLLALSDVHAGFWVFSMITVYSMVVMISHSFVVSVCKYTCFKKSAKTSCYFKNSLYICGSQVVDF